MPPMLRKVIAKNEQLSDFPPVEEFIAKIDGNRKKILASVLKYVENEYLPALKMRLANWLHNTATDVEYEEKLPKNKLGPPGCSEEVSRFISGVVNIWFTDKGYTLDTLYVSQSRLFLRLRIKGINDYQCSWLKTSDKTKEPEIISVPVIELSQDGMVSEQCDSMVYIDEEKDSEESTLLPLQMDFYGRLQYMFLPRATTFLPKANTATLWLYSKLPRIY